jgi:hypothetical protein
MRSVAILASLLLVASVMAGDWYEVGDAIDVPPGQATNGTGPLNNIYGSIGTTADADLYCIYINDAASFSATTVGMTTLDTQLWLFDENGYGVAFDDDDPGGAGLQSTLSSAFVTSNGFYLLGISTYNNDAVDAGGQFLWNSSPFNVERAPDGPGAANPLAGWDGNGFSTGDYGIALSGATYCIPEPATFGMLAVIGLVLRRRR